jgi:hypothetical protein
MRTQRQMGQDGRSVLALPGLSLGPGLDAAVDRLPSEALRAFARLQLSAVPARRHLLDGVSDASWPGFVAVGPAGTGKTEVARLLCEVFGVDPGVAILSGASLRGSTPGFGDLPYVCCDGWERAPSDAQRAAGGWLLGYMDSDHSAARTFYVTLDISRGGPSVLHRAHARSAVVIDTTPARRLRGRPASPALPIERMAIPRIDLATTCPPAADLPSELRDELQAQLHAGLTSYGWDNADARSLERLALGRAALTGWDLRQAVLATAMDYLTCVATLGHTRRDATAELAPQLRVDQLPIDDRALVAA